MAAQSPQRPASRASSGPVLVPMGHHTGKPPVPLARPVTVVGSRSTARIHLISSTVSKAHALIVKSNGGVYIRDLASRSHLYVNGDQVREADLSEGDLIKIGSFTFKYKAASKPPPGDGPGVQASPATLEVTGGDFPIPVEDRVILIGRRSSCDIALLEDSASTAHAVIFEMDGERYVRDLGSRTGTYVNGVNTHQHKLAPGDVIRIGETDIRYQIQAEGAAAAPAAAGESATGYALEAPQDEVDLGLAQGDAEEHDTIGGLDLMGELVQEELARDRRLERERQQRPAASPAARGREADLEPLPLEGEAPPLGRDERPAAEPLEPVEAAQEAAADLVEPLPVANADIEDFAAELLADEPAREESSSAAVDEVETEPRASDATDEAAPEPAAAPPLEAQEASPTADAPEQEPFEPADAEVQAAESADPESIEIPVEAELHPRRGWRSAIQDEAADAETSEAASQELPAVPLEPAGTDEPPAEAADVAEPVEPVELEAEAEGEPAEAEISPIAEAEPEAGVESEAEPVVADSPDAVIAAADRDAADATVAADTAEPATVADAELHEADVLPVEETEVEPEPRAAEVEGAVEADRGETHEPQEQTSEVLRFPDTTSAAAHDEDDFAGVGVHDDSASGGGATAVLDQDALAVDDTARREGGDDIEVFDLSEAFSRGGEGAVARSDTLEGLSVEPDDLHLSFGEPPPDEARGPEQSIEQLELSSLDLGEPPLQQSLAAPMGEDAAAPAASVAPEAEAPEAEAPAQPSDEPPAELDFKIEEPLSEQPLVDVEKLAPPPPPLKLSEDAEALMQATEALTRRHRYKRRPKVEPEAPQFDPRAFDAPEPAQVEPFAFEEPAFELPPAEQTAPPRGPKEAEAPELEFEPAQDEVAPEAPAFPAGEPTGAAAEDGADIEIVDPTLPTPESALDLDRDTGESPLDESAIAAALAGDLGDSGDATAASVDALTDTTFAHAVEEFAGESAGEIVEADIPAEHDARQREDEPAEPPAPGRKHDQPTPPAAPSARPVHQARPPEPFQIGANAENFLGGVPLPRVSPAKPKPVHTLDDPVADLIAEIDHAAEAAERARAQTAAQPDPEAPLTGDAQPPAGGRDFAAELAHAPFTAPMPAAPRSPRKPIRPGARRGIELGILPTNIDEQIPPFAGSSPTSGSITTGFDGLAMPPVRQADVFSQMSPPASAESPAHGPDAGRDAAATRAAADVGSASPAAADAPQASRRRPGSRGGSGVFKVPFQADFAGGAVPADPPGYDAGADKLAPDAAVAPSPHVEPASPVPGPLDDLSPQRRRVRPAIPDTPPPGVPLPIPSSAAERRPAIMYSGDEIEINPGQIRRKYVRRVPLLIMLMLGLIAAAAAGIYGFVPVRHQIEANLTYAHLDQRTKRDREEIQADQIRRLRSDYLREVARRKVLQTPEVSPGFLDDPVQYSRVIDRAGWPDGGQVLKLRYEGTQKDADAVRMKALATALYDDNREHLLKDARNARTRVQELEESIRTNERRLAEVRSEIAAQRILYERKPTAEQVKTLENELVRLEDEWKRAVAAVKDAEAELNRLKQSAGATAATGAGGADGAAPAAAANDEELAKMEAELKDLESRMQAAQSASSEQAAEARARLDDAMRSFQEEIASARNIVSGNPELSAYVTSAQKLQETTREVIEDMVRRQEQQFNSLMELRARLQEKMQARRDEMWQQDEELQRLTEELAILTRQYNAAVGAGYKEEAVEKQSQVNLVTNMIRARQELIPADPGYAEAIAQLEQFIDSTKQNIRADRERTDDLLARLQQSFTPAAQMDKLPADQKELAKRLEEKLASINEARQQYTQTLDEGAEAPGQPELQQQITALRSGIEVRRRQLSDASATAVQGTSTEVKVAQQQTQLDNLKAQERKAEEAYFASRKDLENARTAVADARSSFEKLEKLETERNRLDAELRTQNNTLVDAQRELAAAVEPQVPTDQDIIVREGADRRPTLVLITSGAIFLVFVGLIGLTWQRAIRETPVSALAPGELRPIEHPKPQPLAGANGNGVAANSNGSEEDHEPAII